MIRHRLVAQLLTLLLVPTIYIAASAPPAAALASVAAHGPVVKAEPIRVDHLIPGLWYTCSLVGNTRLHDTGLYSVRARIRCTWGFQTNIEYLRVSAYGSGGEDCAFGAEAIPIEKQADREVTLVAVLQNQNGANPNCVLDRVYVQPYANDVFFGTGCPYVVLGEDTPDIWTRSDNFCYMKAANVAWPLGVMPKAAESDDYSGTGCPSFNVTKAPRLQSFTVEGFPSTQADGSSHHASNTGRPSFRLRPIFSGMSWTNSVPANAQLYIYPVWKRTYDNTYNYTIQGSTTTYTNAAGATRGISFGANYQFGEPKSQTLYPKVFEAGTADWWNNGNSSGNADEAGRVQIVGFQYRVHLGASNTAAAAQKIPTAGATGSQRGFIGVTRPSECLWYFGEQVNQFDPGDNSDEPAGPLRTTPPPTDAPPEPELPSNDAPADDTSGQCEGFSLTDPSSWAGAGICQLVKMLSSLFNILRSIVDAIKGLVKALIDGIAAAIKALFVPSSGFLDGKLDEVKSAWDDTPPGEVIETYQGVKESLVVPASLGCAGPELSFNMPLVQQDINWNLFSTCESWKAQIARIVHTAITVTAYLGAFFLSARIIMAAFGLNAPSGGRDDD